MIADPLIDLPDDETRPSNYYLRDTIKLLMFRIDVDNKELDNKTHDTENAIKYKNTCISFDERNDVQL